MFILKKHFIRLLLVVLMTFSSHLFAKELSQLNLGILSLAPPSKIYKQWKPFADYLGSQLNMKVNIVAPRGFGKLKKMAENKKVDIFYTNSYIFYRLKQAGKAVALAQMENVAGSITSKSDIFVRADAKIDNISQLKGKKIAFVSPMGAGGYLAPRAFLYKEGLKTKEESTEVFTKNLTNSIYGVLLGKVDAATMCGVNYKLMSKKINTGEIKIIASSTNYPENAFAAHAKLPKKLIDKIKSILVSMSSHTQGQKVLSNMKAMKIKRFLPYDDKVEKLTRTLMKSGKFSE